ncbi:Inositol oxygenase [Seminavis robusta]|uniref:Inositol oxygenase n=1 Tax=Seminavis robusta TaxID=568900 RepID=A0A9N8HXJ6_9STRA|nr:Inositol oxygenase [Seminavis robusta]|eukprot:Sro1819_g299630.1 Inositol oxygenase (636) ;mRNA; r:6028-7935
MSLPLKRTIRFTTEHQEDNRSSDCSASASCCSSSSSEATPRKRARCDWKSTSKETTEQKTLSGLQDLFDGRRWRGGKKSSVSSPVTFRLEHRQGGPLATYPGEERILLFRSDLKGAIAKIIFSYNEFEAAAKIHVLDVKGSYRGFDLGGLLFSETVRTLQDRGKAVCCELDAEEDVRRHNKLVGFYSQLGCVVKPNTRPQFLNNNDGETYRKVPMQIDLQATADHPSCLIKTTMGGFMPIVLLGSKGREGKLDDNSGKRQQHWLMAQDGRGHVQFRTTTGHYLSIDPEGRCTEQEEQSYSNGTSTFELRRMSDNLERAEETSEHDLWIVLSHFGTYLYLDPISLHFEGTKTPSFWKSNSDELSLTCTSDTPPRRQFYRQSWIRQTVHFVQECKKKYQCCQLGRMTLQEALTRVKHRKGFPWRMDACDISLRSVCFETAEAARAAGHPDWVQLVALVHGLASVVHDLEEGAAGENDDYDWTLPSTSRVVGCAHPNNAIFTEFKDLNSDEHDDRYSTPLGVYTRHCGLANVDLTWSGPEYLHMMLQHNEVDLPQEGFDLLRLFQLRDWHTKGLYDSLANEDDEEIQSFIVDFDQLRKHTLEVCLSSPELTDTECDQLWRSHYACIAAKFGADVVLEW